MGYQMTLNGVRLGYFAYMEDKGRLQKEDGKLDISQNLMASSVGASLGTLVSNPLYLTKCRQQGKVAQQILEGKRLEYKGTWNIIKNIIQTQGVLGPYKGALPAMLISVYGSSIQLLTFQLTKREIDKVAWIPEGYASFGSAEMAGLVLTVAMLPFDVVVSRFIIQPRDEKGMGILYRNYKEVCEVVFRHEGISGFLRGFLLSYLKNGPHTFILLFTWDLVRAYQRFLN